MDKTSLSLRKIFPYLLVVIGIWGIVASLILSYDTLSISRDSHYVPSCNLNPILSCGNVINATGDKIFGIPYPYYGIAAYAVLATTGIAMLAGARFKKWYWLTFQIIASLGTISAYLLLLKSMFKIHALCPYCLSIDFVTTILLWYLTLYNFDTKILQLKNSRSAKKTYQWVRKHHLDLLILWFLIVIGFILYHFWYYYGKHL